MQRAKFEAYFIVADLKWLSAFPEEEEILYPPRTYLK
jgi:hypothetical protein